MTGLQRAPALVAHGARQLLSPRPPCVLQSNKVPVVQPSHGVHPLTPLIPYSNDHFSHGSHSPHLPADINQKQGNGTAGDLRGGRGTVLETTEIRVSNQWEKSRTLVNWAIA